MDLIFLRKKQKQKPRWTTNAASDIKRTEFFFSFLFYIQMTHMLDFDTVIEILSDVKFS